MKSFLSNIVMVFLLLTCFLSCSYNIYANVFSPSPIQKTGDNKADKYVVALDDIINNSFWRASESETKQLIDQLFNLGKEKNDNYAIAVAHLYYARFYERAQDIVRAKRYAALALSYYDRTGNQLGICKTLRQQGFIAFKSSNMELALDLAYKAFDISEKLNNPVQEGLCLSQLGLFIFGTQVDEGIQVFTKGFNLLVSSGAKRDASIAAVTLSTLYLNIADIPKAKHYIDTFFILQKGFNDFVLLADGKGNASLIALALGKQKEAERYLEESGEYFYRINSDVLKAKFHRTRSIFFRDSKRYAEAIEAAQTGLAYLKDVEGLDNEKGMLQYTLFLSYKGLQKFDLAIAAYEEAVNHEFNQYDEQSQLGIANVKEKYETEKKEQENVELRHVNEINRLKIGRTNYFLIGGSIFCVLIVLLSFLFYRYLRIKSRAKNIQLKQRLLVSQMNPHFIFNSLNSIQNFIYKQNVFEASSYLSRFAELMRMILNYSRKDLITIEEETKMLQNYLEIQKLRFGEQLEWEIYCADDLVQESVLIPPMLSQPFIENSLEHGLFRNDGVGKISIRFEKEVDKLVLTIQDNGVGLDRNETVVAEHESLAMKITEERIEGMNQANRVKTLFNVINLNEEEASTPGVKVVFKMPFQTKF